MFNSQGYEQLLLQPNIFFCMVTYMVATGVVNFLVKINEQAELKGYEQGHIISPRKSTSSYLFIYILLDFFIFKV